MRLLLSLPALALLLTPASGQQMTRHCGNVLILVADDMGVDHVGVYDEGVDPASTPTIDALAANGVLFRNAWADPVCSPTRAQIMTGRYGFRTGIGVIIDEGGWGLGLAEETLPEVLDRFPQLGYSHAAIGKWHLGNGSVGGNFAPNLAGWSHFTGSLGNLNSPETYFDFRKVTNGVPTQVTTYATTDTVDDAIAWIQSVPEPWVCYVAFNAPHTPLHEPPAALHSVTIPQVPDPRCEPIPFYRAMCEAMDTEIDRLLTTIGGRLANTTVIFVGDNGTPNHGVVPPWNANRAKRTPYEGGINVPLIVSGPGVVLPGREVDGLVNTTDIFATTLELAFIDPVAAFPPSPIHDSISLVPYLKDPQQTSLRQFNYADFFRPNDPSGVGSADDWRMFRDDQYKLMRLEYEGQPLRFEFYDLVADPFELVDLTQTGMSFAQNQAFMQLRNELLALLATGP